VRPARWELSPRLTPDLLSEAGMQLFKTPKEPSAKAAVIAKIGLLQTSLHETPAQWTSYLT